jgi:hypothetical protein
MRNTLMCFMYFKSDGKNEGCSTIHKIFMSLKNSKFFEFLFDTLDGVHASAY